MPCWRAPKRWVSSSWKVRACGARLLDMRPDRFEDIIALVALYRPGPMANIPTYCARKHRMEQPDYIHPKLEPVLRRDFRGHRLSGAGDAGGTAARRIFARRSRSAAPRDGKEDSQRDAETTQPLRVRLRRARHRAGPGRDDIRAARALCRLRISTRVSRRLCAGRVSDRLHEGELSGRVSRRLHDAGHGQYRQAFRISCRGQAPRGARSSRHR